MALPPAEAAPVVAHPHPAAGPARRRGRLAPIFAIAAAVLLLAVGAGLLGMRLVTAPDGAEPQVAEVGGEVREAPSLSGTSDPTPRPTEHPEASPPAATPEPTVEPTPAPTAAPTPQPPAPTPAPVAVVPEPGQPVAAAATADPAQAVATWYDLVAAGRFDEAYAMWSPRMQASFDRQGNLDGRWDNTASVTINSVYVTNQSGGSAAVQIDFTETYDAGSARRFVGWWELVLVDGHWLLDWPHF
jgi:cytoskeletal protein RodZ